MPQLASQPSLFRPRNQVFKSVKIEPAAFLQHLARRHFRSIPCLGHAEIPVHHRHVHLLRHQCGVILVRIIGNRRVRVNIRRAGAPHQAGHLRHLRRVIIPWIRVDAVKLVIEVKAFVRIELLPARGRDQCQQQAILGQCQRHAGNQQQPGRGLTPAPEHEIQKQRAADQQACVGHNPNPPDVADPRRAGQKPVDRIPWRMPPKIGCQKQQPQGHTEKRKTHLPANARAPVPPHPECRPAPYRQQQEDRSRKVGLMRFRRGTPKPLHEPPQGPLHGVDPKPRLGDEE